MQELLKFIGKANTFDLLSLFEQEHIMSFTDILNFMPDINHTQLSNRLKEMIKYGWIVKHLSKHYEITAKGMRAYLRISILSCYK